MGFACEIGFDIWFPISGIQSVAGTCGYVHERSVSEVNCYCVP